ncbi:hypothetical protein IscW_ISCW003126 [Ixodes scapularis]|uniref:G-protein coupled receptors family 1 profile domain-containing protein n=1 Tax=Ixodes scapularis TaxID=6945 RepID=B7PCS1_IXOSC|nr:hypothetical protein IscW_ISCW003126 [Ixodes scapularis]|eukprot:XP_002410166.1 hypothetical protein IscW_ISCW003126 [Ixodes scapularis]
MSDCAERGVGGRAGGRPLPRPLFLERHSCLPGRVVWDGPLIQRVATLSIIMLFTLTGNLAILVVLSRPRIAKRASRVNLFIFNLALGTSPSASSRSHPSAVRARFPKPNGVPGVSPVRFLTS